ncbi:hypothetical protein M413DRAFT_242335 [Hebeloma cylindrosporum]|uniref:Uncharacterized protein n=1 Tax=Hebeloma cylindrosporum TaxID=76867 RepID=A0A0C3BP88_HEBCY|nr:hypothetical protein M413DRAFT_242335 [Hebeloma cylindrosporum h7]
MADHRNYSYSSAGPSHKQPADPMQRTLTRNSQQTHHSVADSTASRIQNHGQPGRPMLPPPSIETPFAERPRPPRPLPNPHQRPLHVVNVPDTPFRENEEHQETVDGDRMEFGYHRNAAELGNSAATSSAPSAAFVHPPKKKVFVGGFVKRIRRLPKTMFGYGAGIGRSDRDKLQRSGTLLTDATSTSATGTTGNTLPVYSTNPPTPVVTHGRSGLRVPYTAGLLLSTPREPPIPESPPPDVVRLSSNRVSVPDNFGDEENGRLPVGPDRLTRKPTNELPYGRQADRATVMLYHDQSRYYEEDRLVPPPVPPAVSRQPSGVSAISYVADPLPLQPVRPSSFHSSHTVTLPPLEMPKRAPTPGPNGPRVSYASQAVPAQSIPQSLIPGPHPSPGPPTQVELQSVQSSLMQQVNPPPQPTEDVQSPVTAHPKHTDDYRKMTTSPSPTSHNTFATGSSYYDPSFSSQLNPVERFFATLYRMPWISHDRITVDYLPGTGAGVRRKRKMKPISSWYRSVLSRSSRNSTLDALSNGTMMEASPRSNLRASLALILGSPSSRQSPDRQRSKGHRSHAESKDSHPRHHRSSRRRHRTHHSHTHTERIRTTTSVDTVEKDGYVRTESSPLIPSMYPYHYPPYPYPSYPGFPVPAPGPTIGDERLSKESHKRASLSPRGPRAVPQQSPMFYAPAPGYASYQPMIAPPLPPLPPPHVYFLQSPILSPTYGGVVASVPPALVPGGVHENGHAHGSQHGGGGQVQQQVQPAAVSSGSGSGQSVPGAFSIP